MTPESPASTGPRPANRHLTAAIWALLVAGLVAVMVAGVRENMDLGRAARFSGAPYLGTNIRFSPDGAKWGNQDLSRSERGGVAGGLLFFDLSRAVPDLDDQDGGGGPSGAENERQSEGCLDHRRSRDGHTGKAAKVCGSIWGGEQLVVFDWIAHRRHFVWRGRDSNSRWRRIHPNRFRRLGKCSTAPRLR